VDCLRCHTAPTGVATTTTGTAYRTAWAFHHPPTNTALDFCWQCHPRGPPN